MRRRAGSNKTQSREPRYLGAHQGTFSGASAQESATSLSRSLTASDGEKGINSVFGDFRRTEGFSSAGGEGDEQAGHLAVS